MNIENVSFFSVFLAGFLSVLTPPALIIMPAYLAYLSGSNPLVRPNRTRHLIFLGYALMFWVGFALLFMVLFGSPMGSLGRGLLTIADILPLIGGLLLILFAIYVSLRTFLQIFLKEKFASLLTSQIDTTLTIINCLRSAFLGMVFAAGWTLIIGPILGDVLAIAIPGQNIGLAMFYLMVYALGLAIPLIIIALLLMYLTNYLRNLHQYMGMIEHFVSAFVLFISGIMLLTGINSYLSSALTPLIPIWLISRM